MDEPTLGVRELLGELRALLDEALPEALWVQGEIRGLTRSRPGHVYFDLVEPGDDARKPEAKLPVALFAGDRARVERSLRDAGAGTLAEGLEVRVHGRVSLYVARSQVQLIVRAIDPTFTLGRLEQARRALLVALEREGLLRRNAEVPLPRLPRRVALVTSASSAACADTLHELETSGLGWDVALLDTPVQGEQAAAAIARALGRAARTGAEIVLLVRGGGSKSDLVAFDSEVVARAVATCPLPVWTGIGHEIDRSVADEVAHTAHKTPTACAAALAALVRQDLDAAGRAWAGIERVCRARLAAEASTLRRTDRRVEQLATARLRTEAARLDALRHGLVLQARTRLAAQRSTLAVADARVAAADPARLLRRGWSLTTVDGALLRSVQDVRPGATIATRVADGTVQSTVDSVLELEVRDGSEA